ncbi:fungal-specific transcription factor domain-containing protein [Suillus occidentalis]|nr:fungal-specific transcription factor domain-containing protein [Suillus occidentalis]
MLCPNGTMPPGKGSRFVGVAEEYLRHKAAKLEERMRSLEDALAILQGNTSTQPHPLLTTIWSNEEADSDTPPAMAEFNTHDGLIDALGSLHLDGDPQSGTARFFGPSGGSESLLLAEKRVIPDIPAPSTETQETEADYLSHLISNLDQAFPLTPSGLPKEQIQEIIESYLPEIQRAVSLCETFLKSLSWLPQIVSRQQTIDHLIPLTYRPGLERPRCGPHDLALLFSVLALGALVDPTLPPYNAEARHYHRVARAALCLQSVFSERSVVTIKALHLMSMYYGMSGIESNAELCYSLLNLACQAALQIGFHKDPSRWGIKGREAYERRSYFWTLFSQSLWQSLATGRPPAIIPAVADCQVPNDLDEATYRSRDIPISFGNWSSHFTKECLAPIIEATQAVKPPDYQTILELDRKIRQFPVPELQNSTPFDRAAMEMHAFSQSRYKELTLMFLHRGFFAQAMGDFPSDPLRSPVGRSFMVAYQCASVLITVTINQFELQPVLCSRVWRVWTIAFSAAVIVGTVAIRRPGIPLDPDPFEHLEKACTLFHDAAQTCSRAKTALPILLRLRQKAVHARMDPLQIRHASHNPKPSESEDEPDELDVFGGRTQLVTKSTKQVPWPPRHPIQLSSSTASQNNPPDQRNNYQLHLMNIPDVQDYALGEGAVGLSELALLREISGPLYSRSPCAPSFYGPQHGQQGDLMLQDRWSSFLNDASLPQGYLSHLGPQAR